MSLVSPQNKLKIEVCTICFKKIRDACFSSPKFGSTENVLIHLPQKRDDSKLTISTRTYSWQKLNKTVVIFQWIFFVLKGQHHQLLQPVESSSQVDGLTWKMIFHFLSWFFVTLNCTNMFGATVKCHQRKEIMPCGNVSSFFVACSASDWFIVAIGDPKPTLTDRIMPIPNMHASEQEEDFQKKCVSKF